MLSYCATQTGILCFTHFVTKVCWNELDTAFRRKLAMIADKIRVFVDKLVHLLDDKLFYLTLDYFFGDYSK